MKITFLVPHRVARELLEHTPTICISPLWYVYIYIICNNANEEDVTVRALMMMMMMMTTEIETKTMIVIIWVVMIRMFFRLLWHLFNVCAWELSVGMKTQRTKA